jgi:nicotinamide riboside kinase
MSRAFVVALLGAESTGKTTLAAALVEALRADGLRYALVAEALREFCDRERRTPRRDEQAGIADEQSRRIEAAREEHDVVVADTTALQIAVYSDLVFGDRSLYAAALAFQRTLDLTLLTALDVPWQADRFLRDGPHVREPVDALLRSALTGENLCFSVVAGTGTSRLAHALAAVRHALPRAREAGAGGTPGEDGANGIPSPWQHACERCGDPRCERRLLARA